MFRCIGFEHYVISRLENENPGNVNMLQPFGDACFEEIVAFYIRFFGIVDALKIDWECVGRGERV